MLSLDEYIGMAALSWLMNIRDDRNQLFPLLEWLSFGKTPQDNQIFFPTTSKYTKDYTLQ
jgi:hypothetical protein